MIYTLVFFLQPARWWDQEFKKIQDLFDMDVPEELHSVIWAIAYLEGLSGFF